MFRRVTLGLLIILFLSACQGGPKSTPTETQVPTQEATVQPEVTLTPIVPTETSTATLTPQPATQTITPTVNLQLLSTITSTATPTEAVVLGPDNFPTNVDPLTGQVVADPKLLDRRPIAIKVNIVPRSTNRPPWGLSFADIVYDYYHNAGYTRFHAIFYGKDAELVGPIRSGRLLDSDLIRMYQSIFAYGSADPIINRRLLNAEFSSRLILEGGSLKCPPTPAIPLCRYDPSGNDFLLGSTSALSQDITAKKVSNGRQNLDGMTFSSASPADGSAGSQMYVRYSGDDYARWDYDPASGKYLRFQDEVYDQGQGESYVPLIDRLNNQQISADNVIFLIVPHVYFRPPPGEIVEILLSGTGKAYAFRDGHMYQVSWNRPGNNSVLYLTFNDGTRYPFKPGNTWIQVLSDTSQVTSQAGGVFRFAFRFP